MATNLISNAYLNTLLKTVYDSGVYNAKYQNSPVLSAIAKETWEGGDTFNYAVQYSNGGNFGSDYAALVNAPTSGAKNLQWAMKQGYLTGFFTINQPEILMSRSDRGSFMKFLDNEMAATFDGLSKMLATYLYGGQWGVVYKFKTGEGQTLSGTTHKFPITSDGAIKLDIGSRFVIATAGVADSAVPSSNLLSSGVVFTVTKIGKDYIEATTAAAETGTVYDGDYIELYTARSGSTPIGPDGLSDLIPDVDGRDETPGSVWNTYIGTSFRGVDRSVAPERLAGQFANVADNSGSSTPITDTLVDLLEATKRAGGLNNIIVVGDTTFNKIGKELNVQRNLWQSINTGSEKNSFTAGYSNLATSFGEAFISRTVIDPFCPDTEAYMFEKDDLRFMDLGNVSKVINTVANDQLGKADIEAVGDQGIGDTPNLKLNWDKLFNIEQGVPGTFGPAVRISANIYGNFRLRKTASMGVAKLA